MPPSANGARRDLEGVGRGGGNDRGEGRAVEEREARSEKVMVADPIRVSHLLKLLRAREDLTQAEPSPRYHVSTAVDGSF